MKIVDGSYRGDRDDQGAGKNKPIGLPTCPVWLPKKAKKYWKEIGPQLASAGLVSLLDSAAFAAHCDSVVDIRLSLKEEDSYGVQAAA